MRSYILLYSKLYFTLGQRGSDGLGDILPTLIAVAELRRRPGNVAIEQT